MMYSIIFLENHIKQMLFTLNEFSIINEVGEKFFFFFSFL